MHTNKVFGRKSPRMKGFDYSAPGYYAVTMCTLDRQYYFGDVLNYEMKLSPLGALAEQETKRISSRFSNIDIDVFAIMPNHIHAIFAVGGGGSNLVHAVGGFKHVLSLAASKQFGIKGLWQRSFYDHVIRSEYSLQRHREYVIANPAQWDVDELNKANWKLYLEQNPNLRWHRECS